MANTDRVLVTVPVKRIKTHSTNERIYGPTDAELVEDIRKYGLQCPPEVTEGDFTLISGYRRLAALRKLGVTEVQCIVRYDLKDPLDREVAIVMANRYREKSNDQKAAEVAWLMHIEKLKADQRMKAGLRQNVSDPSAPVRYREKQGENDRDNSSHETGKAAEKVGQVVGWSENTARAAAEVHDAIVEAEQTGDMERAADLRTTLNEEGVKPAHRKLVKPDAVTDRLGNPVPGCLIVTFEQATEFASLMFAVGAIRTRIQKLRETPAGVRITQDAEILTEKLQHELRNARPHCGCIQCKGRATLNGKPCDWCRESGFLTQAQYENLSSKQKEQIPVVEVSLPGSE